MGFSAGFIWDELGLSWSFSQSFVRFMEKVKGREKELEV